MDFQLSDEENATLTAVVERVAEIDGVEAIVLGGSRAAGTHRASSDVDLGLYYEREDALDLDALRRLAHELDDGDANPVVTAPWEWGRWVNGGAWLRVGGRRVDWIYRHVPHVERILEDLSSGTVEFDWIQQPPFGFASNLYGAETARCIALHDPKRHVGRLKERIEPYPEALRLSIVQNWSWAADFALIKAAGFSERDDALNTLGSLTRSLWFLGHVIHALDRVWCFPDQAVVSLASDLPSAPTAFGPRVQQITEGTGPSTLPMRVRDARDLAVEIFDTAGDLYRPPPFPRESTRSETH